MSALNPFEAQAKLAKLPVSPEAIDYLMALANGANSEIPRFMALGRLEQMKQELASNKPSQPPQGTVKDKIEQAVGIMALRGGQQQQAAQQMAQAAPQGIPQGIPQPQMQPQPEEASMPEEETQMAAGGGLMRARIDPRMFDFAPGGIVSFDDGGEVLDKATAERQKREAELRTYGLNQRRADPEGYQAKQAALAAAVQQEAEVRRQYEADMAKSGAASPAFSRRDVGAAKGALGIASAPEVAAPPAPAPAPAPKPVSEGPSTLGPAQQEYIRLIKQGMPPAMAEKVLQTSMGATQSGIAAAPRPPAAPAAPRPPAAPAAPAAPAPGLDQGVGALAKTLTPQVNATQVRAAYAEADPTVRSVEQIAEDQKKIYDLTGVGTYGTERRKQIANMRQEFEQSRPSTSEDVIDMIRAGIRPGAIAGAAGEYSSQLKREREARLSFSKAEDALKDAVEKADEAVRSGKASDIIRARDEERKAKADYKKAKVEVEKSIMTAEGSAAEKGLLAATQLETNKQTNATNVEINRLRNLTDIQVANIREAAARYGYDRPTESDRIFGKYSEILKSGGQKAADAFLADQARVRATVLGVKYEGQPEKKAAIELKVQEEVRKRVPNIDLKLQNPKLSPADRAKYEAARELVEKDVRRKLRNATGDEEGGSGDKVATEADIQATMSSSRKSRDEVVRALKANGFTIQ